MRAIRSSRGRVFAFIVAATAVGVSGAARADDAAPAEPAKEKTALEEASEIVLDEDASKGVVGAGEIVVSAEGGGVPLMYPGARDVIDAREVSQYQGGNLSDVVRRIPGMYVTQTTGNEAYLNVGSRGLSPQRGRYVGWLLDGMPLSMAPYGLNDKDLFPVTMERVGTIDSIRGGAALRFGSHSVGGVVNLLSPEIPTEPTATARVKVGSDAYRATVFEAGGTWGPVGVSLIQVDKAGDGWRDEGEFDIRDFYGRFRWKAGEDDTFLFTIGRFLIHASLPGGTTEAEYERDHRSSIRPLDDSHGDRTVYGGNWTHRFGRTAALDVTVMWQDVFSEVRITRPNSPPFTRLESKPTTADTLWTQARFTWEAEILGMTHRFSHMLQWEKEHAENDWERVPIVAGAGPTTVTQHSKFEGDGVALFNEDVIDVVKNVQASVAYRMESINMSSENQVVGGPPGRSEHYNVRLPAASLAWTFLPRTAAFIGVQKSFRTPYYDNFDPAANANNEVQPELARSREIGVRTRGHWGFSGSVTAFRNVFTDQAIPVPGPGGATVFENAGRTVNEGFEYELSYDAGALAEPLKGLSAYVTLTDQESVFKTGDFKGNDTPNAPRRLLSCGFAWDLPEGFWVRADGSSAGRAFAQQENYRRSNPEGNEGMQPGSRVWDLAFGWHQNADRTGLALSAGVTNVFDGESFYRNSQGIWASPGRSLFLSLGYTIRW